MTPAQGVMFKFTYLEDPKHNPDRVFDVVRFFQGSDAAQIKLNAKYHAFKTGAIAVSTLTPQQYQELINEEAKQESSNTTTEEAHQA